jgi:hypothetical protein
MERAPTEADALASPRHETKEKLGLLAELFLPLLVSPVIARIWNRKQSNCREWRHWGRRNASVEKVRVCCGNDMLDQ